MAQRAGGTPQARLAGAFRVRYGTFHRVACRREHRPECRPEHRIEHRDADRQPRAAMTLPPSDPSQTRPTAQGSARLTVELDAICANWRALGGIAGGAEVGAVVKANAYGLGAERVARALAGAGARSFFVAQAARPRPCAPRWGPVRRSGCSTAVCRATRRFCRRPKPGPCSTARPKLPSIVRAAPERPAAFNLIRA